jgi:tetratricopeptide (TPR) repeat protein
MRTLEPVMEDKKAWIEDVLARLRAGEEIEDLLPPERSVPLSLIRQLKEEVARLIRMEISAATRVAEATRVLAAACEDPTASALAFHACALARHFSGQYQEALDCYERAEAIYRQLGREVEAARIARAKVDVLMYRGDYERALAVAAWAREVFRRHGESLLLAQLETNVGNIYHRLDRYREALRFYEYAREIFLQQGDELGLALTHFNSANQYTSLGEFERALASYQEARRIYEKLSFSNMVNEVDYSLAWLAFQRGRFHESLTQFAEVKVRARESGDAVLAALCDLDMAEIYLHLNAYEDAGESARSAAEVFAQLKMNYERAKAQMYLGLASAHRRDLSAAAHFLEEARRGFHAEGNFVWCALSNLYLSEVLIAQNQWEAAWQLGVEARALFQEQGLVTKVASAELQLARIQLAKGDVQDAERFCRFALNRIRGRDALELKQKGWHLLGAVLEQKGDEERAYRAYRRAIAHLEDLRSHIRVDEYRCTFVSDKLSVYEDLTALCLRAGTPEKVAEAFAVVEAAKARALAELLAAEQRIESKRREPRIERLHREWNRVREELNWLFNRLQEQQLHPTRRRAPAEEELRREIRRRERQLRRLSHQLQMYDAEYADLRVTSHVSAPQVQEVLQEDVFLEYFLARGKIGAFILTRDEISVFPEIAEADRVAPLLRQLRFALRKFALGERYAQAHLKDMSVLVNHYLRELYQALIAPIESALEGERVIIAPSGFLHYVPFHALQNGREYLADQREVSYCPSASVYRLCVQKARTRPRGGPAVIVGVWDEATPFVREEVAELASIWTDALVLTGEAATLENFRRAAPSGRVLHLASHGLFRPDNPLFSALRLKDGWLNFYDIFNLTLRAELVVLSACETGMNAIFPGDELFGLMRGFLYAGVPSLLASLWTVSDRSTATFMRYFYAGWQQGLSKRAALRNAHLAVRARYEHPYYWAPFVLIGAPF